MSADKTAKIWNILEDGNAKVDTTFNFSEGTGAEAMQVGCLWLNEYLITVSLSGTISYLSPSHPDSPSKMISGHMKSITTIAVNVTTSNAELFSCSYDGLIVRWVCGAGYKSKLEKKDSVHIKAITIAGDSLITCGLDNKVLLLFDILLHWLCMLCACIILKRCEIVIYQLPS